jgi:ribosome-associated translation inhibitor RaiA
LEHTEQRLRFALTRTSARIKRVVVRLGNTNRPRGGENKFCRMQVYLEHALPVLIEDSGDDLFALIDRAAERAGRNVTRDVDRLPEKYRLGTPPPASLPGDAVDMSKNEGVRP